jgi:hypothetical protein
MKKYLLLFLASVAGFAIACSVRAMPPFKIDVSLWDIAVAWFQGNRTNAANVAFLSNLDDQGKATFGASVWKQDNFQGYVYPTATIAGTTGATQVYVDKPCDQLAKDQAGSGTEYVGGSGGGGGYSGGGTSYGIIGYNPIYRTATVCVGGYCYSEQILVGYEAIYGPIATPPGHMTH